MITHAQGGEGNYYCFARDGAVSSYAILHIRQVKSDQNPREKRNITLGRLAECAAIVGRIQVNLARPLTLIDFSACPPLIHQRDIASGPQMFDVVSLELPGPGGSKHFHELALLPGTFYGLAWTGLIKATADLVKCTEYWYQKQQLPLPFRDPP